MTETEFLPCGPENPKAKGQPEDARHVESIMEHVFLSEVLQYRWFVDGERVDVIRPEVDISGFDLVLESNDRIRHVQLKSRWINGNARSVKVHGRLIDHPDPCVVWVFWSVDAETCRVSAARYRYCAPKTWPLPEPGNTSFILKWGDFTPGYLEIDELVSLLF